MRPPRDRPSPRLGAAGHRGAVAFALLPVAPADQRLLIAATTIAAATLAFLAAQRQIDAESLRLAHAGFAPLFDGAAWVRRPAGGGLAVIRPEPDALRPQMAALCFITAGLMAFAETCDWARDSPRIRSFLGVLGLVGLLAGAGSLFRPRPETMTVSAQAGTIRTSRAPGDTIRIASVAAVAVDRPRWNSGARGYRIAVELRDGGSRAVLDAPDDRTARELAALLATTLDRRRVR